MYNYTPFGNRNSTHRDAALDIHSDQTLGTVVNEEEVRIQPPLEMEAGEQELCRCGTSCQAKLH